MRANGASRKTDSAAADTYEQTRECQNPLVCQLTAGAPTPQGAARRSPDGCYTLTFMLSSIRSVARSKRPSP